MPKEHYAMPRCNNAPLPQRAADVEEQVHKLHAENVVGELVGVAHPIGELLLNDVEQAPGARSG